ncbi:transcription initiation factor TFIID subunit 4b-like, partial [Trifolium medium]|nr:transcription initiation factor TFIID subunit 4b-like [Trifolium medium]
MDPSTVQQMSYLQITENDQPRVQIKNRLPVVPYDQMFPFLIPEIHPDKAIELQALFDKYKRHEMPGHTFFRLMEDIVGEELISSATAKLLEQ